MGHGLAFVACSAPAYSAEIATFARLEIVQPASIALQPVVAIQPPLRAPLIAPRPETSAAPMTGISSPLSAVFTGVRIAGDGNQAVSVTMAQMAEAQGPDGGYRALPVTLQPAIRTGSDGDGALGIAPGTAVVAQLDGAGRLFIAPVAGQGGAQATPGRAVAVTVQYD